MAVSKEVVPWKCHICRREFDAPSGGICSRCNKATCRRHLHLIGQIPGLDAQWVCGNCLTAEEKAKRIISLFTNCRFIALAALVLLAIGFLIDLFSRFHVLRQTRSIVAGLAVLLIAAIFYLAGGAGSEWIGGKDKVAAPLYKRALRFLALLIFAAAIFAVLWIVFSNVIKAL